MRTSSGRRATGSSSTSTTTGTKSGTITLPLAGGTAAFVVQGLSSGYYLFRLLARAGVPRVVAAAGGAFAVVMPFKIGRAHV